MALLGCQGSLRCGSDTQSIGEVPHPKYPFRLEGIRSSRIFQSLSRKWICFSATHLLMSTLKGAIWGALHLVSRQITGLEVRHMKGCHRQHPLEIVAMSCSSMRLVEP